MYQNQYYLIIIKYIEKELLNHKNRIKPTLKAFYCFYKLLNILFIIILLIY